MIALMLVQGLMLLWEARLAAKFLLGSVLESFAAGRASHKSHKLET